MYNELFWVTLVLGLGVLLTYANLMNSGMFLGSLVKPIPIRSWACSMLLTVVSFVYVSNQWIWHLPANATVVGMYTLFLSGALTWAPMIVDALRREKKTFSVALSLWVTASGSIGLLVLSCNHPDNPLLIATSAWLVVHHVFVDAIWWYTRWSIPEESLPLFPMDVDEDRYTNLDYI